MAQEKNVLRAELRTHYAQHDLSAYVASSIAHIEACELFMRSTSVLAYESIRSLEIPFVSRLMELFPDKAWYLPIVVGEGEMIFACRDTMYRATTPTCVIVPSLALDRVGNRLGKGGGYYDRFLEAHPLLQGETLSVVPDFACLSDEYAPEAHDVRIARVFFAQTLPGML
jgi:5,10-methenyltetrahydrofolate synthetase